MLRVFGTEGEVGGLFSRCWAVDSDWDGIEWGKARWGGAGEGEGEMRTVCLCSPGPVPVAVCQSELQAQ